MPEDLSLRATPQGDARSLAKIAALMAAKGNEASRDHSSSEVPRIIKELRSAECADVFSQWSCTKAKTVRHQHDSGSRQKRSVSTGELLKTLRTDIEGAFSVNESQSPVEQE